MRDYIEIIANLRREGTPSALAGAEALEELQSIASRMTTLGVDLEAQIQEDMIPDAYSAGGDGLVFVMEPGSLSELRGFIPPGVPFKLNALKLIGESWFVFLPGFDEPEEYYTQDAAIQASVASKEK